MKSDELLDAIGGIDCRHISAAEEKKTHGKRWVGWIAAAACIGMAVMIMIPMISKDKPSPVNVGGIMRDYKNVTVTGSEEAIEWPWEYKTVFEQYPAVLFEGREYAIKSNGSDMSEDSVGEKLGGAVGVGYDAYTDTEYRQDFDVWQIKGISSDRMIAVLMDGQFYPFKSGEYDPPATLGELLDDYSLPQLLSLDCFYEYSDGRETGFYRLGEDDFIWQTLTACRDALFIEDEAGGRISRDRISFSVTSEALGVYKRAFYVSADGYISTNIFDWAYAFFIGEDAAADIISYARKNAVEARGEPYLYSLAGTLTEIGDGYILVDDSILCKDEKDGIVFRVLTANLRVSRCIDFQKIGVGSIVVVPFTEPVRAEDGYTIDSAISVTRGSINDGEAVVLE